MTTRRTAARSAKTNGAKPTNTTTTEIVADTSSKTEPTITEVIEFEVAVSEGKKVLAKFEGQVRAANMRLGEIAAKVETKYGEKTLEKLAAKLHRDVEDKTWSGVFSESGEAKTDGGIADCTLARTLERNRSVYLAWDGAGIKAPEPVSWAVLKELQSHPEREGLVKANPQLTKAQAHEEMQKLKGTNQKDKGEEDEERSEKAAEEQSEQEAEEQSEQETDSASQWERHNKRWFAEVVTAANRGVAAAEEVVRLAAFVGQPLFPEQMQLLRESTEPKLLAVLKQSSKALREASEQQSLLHDFLARISAAPDEEAEAELAPVVSASACIETAQPEKPVDRSFPPDGSIPDFMNRVAPAQSEEEQATAAVA